MEMNFCYRCGTILTNIASKVYRCENGHTIFENPAPTVGVFFLKDNDEVLLSVRGIEPRKGMLDSFGGFVDSGETIQEAAIRELKEELDLNVSDYEPLRYLGSATGDYPYEGEVRPLISTFFWTRLISGTPLVPHDDVAAIRSIPLADINLDELHDKDIRWGIEELRRLSSENLL